MNFEKFFNELKTKVGLGSYDNLCAHVREQADAGAVAVIVMGGKHGHGFSVQAVHPAFQQQLPDMLEHMAKKIREDQEN